MKILDKKKGIGGEYLNGWAGKALHGQICRNPRNLERDLRRERREGAGSGEGRKKRSRGSGWRRLGRHTYEDVWCLCERRHMSCHIGWPCHLGSCPPSRP
jgi:hypothetical protein